MFFFLLATATRPTLGPTQPPVRWVPGALALRVGRPGRGAGHSLPSIVDVGVCVGLRLHSPNTSS
jgi:hypothetical protein